MTSEANELVRTNARELRRRLLEQRTLADRRATKTRELSEQLSAEMARSVSHVVAGQRKSIAWPMLVAGSSASS